MFPCFPLHGLQIYLLFIFCSSLKYLPWCRKPGDCWRSLCNGVCARQKLVNLCGVGHCNGERMALKWGNKKFYTNLNICPHLTGHDISAGHVHTRVGAVQWWGIWFQDGFRMQSGSGWKIEYKLLVWLPVKYIFQCKNVLPVFCVPFLLEFPECTYINMYWKFVPLTMWEERKVKS